MLTFKEYFEYYSILEDYNIKNIPPIYSELDSWGELHWEHLVMEGLITSYPKRKVGEFITKHGWTVLELDDDIPTTFTKTTPIRAIGGAIDNNLIKGLDSLGYLIATRVELDDGVRISIEPKYPEKFMPKSNKFYHITHRQYLPKIKKIGLTPRESTTTFTHPGGRIYLIQTKSYGVLEGVKRILLRSKLEKLQTRNLPKEVIDSWTIDNLIVLEVDVEGLTLYEDPMFPSKTGSFKSCFTMQNIPENRIKETTF